MLQYVVAKNLSWFILKPEIFAFFQLVFELKMGKILMCDQEWMKHVSQAFTV